MYPVVEKYIKTLDDDEKWLIIQGFEKLKTEGFIGDEPIRIHAKALTSYNSQVTLWMEFLAFECYRYFAYKWIEQHND